MASHRQAAQIDQVVRWLHQARASTGRFQPILAVGRDGVHVPLRHRQWKEGTTATVSVLDRRGKRVGTVDLGQRPEAGQTPLTAPLPALLTTLWSQVDSPGRRFVYGSEEGDHPSDYDHRVWKKMPDPTRPGCPLTWIRLGDSSQAGLYLQQLAEALCGSTPQGRAWAQQRRTPLQTTSDGITRV